MMKQLALDIGLATGPTLARFYAGPNEAALQHLRLAAGEGSSEATRSPVPTYLWGEPGSGKTHLLQAVRQALDLDDTIYTLKLTPNRADCLSILSVWWPKPNWHGHGTTGRRFKGTVP